MKTKDAKTRRFDSLEEINFMMTSIKLPWAMLNPAR
jgi:hypothetical protein